MKIAKGYLGRKGIKRVRVEGEGAVRDRQVKRKDLQVPSVRNLEKKGGG